VKAVLKADDLPAKAGLDSADPAKAGPKVDHLPAMADVVAIKAQV